jgi:hypothetical protein
MNRWLSTFFVICLLTASANALDESDATRIDNLAQKSLQLEKDLSSAQKGSPLTGKAWECLNELHHHVEMVSVQIDWLRSMALLALSMKDKSDEKTVLDFLHEYATGFLEHIDISRQSINSTAGYCSSVNVAVAKAQEVLKLQEEATSVVRSMMSRLR